VADTPISSGEINARLEGEEQPDRVRGSGHPTFLATIVQIILRDIVFSIDSVITAVGMANELWVMMTAVILAVLIMLIAAGPVAAFVNRHPTVKMLALSSLLLIGITLIADDCKRLHLHGDQLFSCRGDAESDRHSPSTTASPAGGSPAGRGRALRESV